jgi:hypothetical protein
MNFGQPINPLADAPAQGRIKVRQVTLGFGKMLISYISLAPVRV